VELRQRCDVCMFGNGVDSRKSWTNEDVDGLKCVYCRERCSLSNWSSCRE
jgi:hypothetical protein